MLEILMKTEMKSVDFSRVKLPHGAAATCGVGCTGDSCCGQCG